MINVKYRNILYVIEHIYRDYCYLCRELRKIVITVLQNVENKKRGKIMKTTNKNNENLIAKLQYQLQRYKAMGNGAICQSLNNRIQRLSAQQKA